MILCSLSLCRARLKLIYFFSLIFYGTRLKKEKPREKTQAHTVANSTVSFHIHVRAPSKDKLHETLHLVCNTPELSPNFFDTISIAQGTILAFIIQLCFLEYKYRAKRVQITDICTRLIPPGRVKFKSLASQSFGKRNRWIINPLLDVLMCSIALYFYSLFVF